MSRCRTRGKWIGLSALAAVAAGGCESTDVRPIDLRSGATYRSPAGNFTCLVPPLLGPGVREQESTADGTAAGVTFDDDFGTLLDVHSQRAADGEPPMPPDAYFDQRVLPALRQRSPAAAALHRATVDTAVGPALFAVVSLPGGSTQVLTDDAGHPYHPDAIRGVLVFPQYRWAYAVSTQLWPGTPGALPLSPAEGTERLLSRTRQAVAQMMFN